MKQSGMLPAKELFPGSETLSKRAFKMMKTRDNCALLTVVCPIQAANAAHTRRYSARLQKLDCFECLSPHKIAA